MVVVTPTGTAPGAARAAAELGSHDNVDALQTVSPTNALFG